ncbi:hypothetical protein C0J52_24867 [Blattella germanica]|nr:hypothetical protein C0J52_24867 [Blattella germanica]
MCPLWPFHLFLIYAIILGPLWMLSTTVVAHVITNTQWGIEFDPSKLKMQLGDVQTVKFSATGLTPSEKQNGIVYVVAENEGTIANVSPEGKTYLLSQESGFVDGNWTSAFNITGNFLGKTYVKLKLENGDSIKESNSLPISVVRPQRVIDSLFLYSVIILVSIIYINFGCALDWSVFKMTIRRPVGPLIGFICQFLLMPVIVIAGLGLPWLGYLGGTIMARLCKQAPDDTLAISIETGIQNTGIAIFLLQVSLGQPEADLTTVVPVAVAIMTPFPLLALFIYYRCSARWSKSKAQVLNPEEEERITSPSSNGTTEPFSIHVGNIK